MARSRGHRPRVSNNTISLMKVIYSFVIDFWFRWRPPVKRWLRIEIERRRLFLWLPVAYGIGIALFFTINNAPQLWITLSLAAFTGGVAIAFRRNWWPYTIALITVLILLGFSAANWRTELLRYPQLNHPQIVPIKGYVLSVDERIQGPRAIINVLEMGEVSENQRPLYIRVSFRQNVVITTGTVISMVARLVPPPEPARPGGYNFARDSYYNGIGAVGSVNGKVVNISDHEFHISHFVQLVSWIDIHRNALTRRILETASGNSQKREQEAAFVAALITGKRGMLSDATNEALRAAGIYHVVSIGGFHMTLVAGTIFFIVRALFAAIPGFALRLPSRKVAAIAGIIGASFYCIFSGAGIDTQRALFVTIIVMGAILVDRPALSMRNLALSAFVCLTFQPETMLGPSFQMSFAGVAALIALFESWKREPNPLTVLQYQDGGKQLTSWNNNQNTHKSKDSFLGSKIYHMILTSVTTTIVAMLATGPFSTYHFQILNPWGLIGNAFGLPLVEIVVMPLSFIAVLLHPIGLDAPFWYLTGLASMPVLEGSSIVAQFEGASLVVPSFGPTVLTLMVFALLWGCLWTTSMRWFAIIPAAVSLIMASMINKPDIYIDREGRGAAVRSANGRLVIMGKPSGFVVEQWLRADGDARRIDNPDLYEDVACDKSGCITKLKDQNIIAFTNDHNALWEDCDRVDIIISRLKIPQGCKAKHVVDRKTLDRYGSMAVHLKKEIFHIDGVKDK